MSKSIHQINTWEKLHSIKIKHEQDAKDEIEFWESVKKNTNDENLASKEECGVSVSLESAYLRAHGEKNKRLMSIHGRDDRTTLKEWGESPIDAFLGLVRMGGYPPPELIKLISECFEYYFEARGKVNLEHVFFGREVPKSGNESGRRKNTELYKSFSRDIFFNKKDGNKLSQVMLAERHIKHCKKFKLVDENFPSDPESFLVNWRRWKKSNK